ncbi:unnamed protein product [Aphanomyces euteiches]
MLQPADGVAFDMIPQDVAANPTSIAAITDSDPKPDDVGAAKTDVAVVDKKKTIPPIVFVPLLGAFLVITVVPSVVSNVVNKNPTPTPAPAAPSSGSSGGITDGFVTPVPAPTTSYSIATVVSNTPVFDVAFHPVALTWAAINSSTVWTASAATAAGLANRPNAGGFHLTFDSAGSLFVSTANQVIKYTGNSTTISPTVPNATSVCLASTGVNMIAIGGMPSLPLSLWNATSNATTAITTTPMNASDMAIYQTTYLYVADAAAHCIRRVAFRTGAVDVFAGSCGVAGYMDGAAASSLWNGPSGIAVDYYGVVYVSDTGNHAVRKIDGTTVSTLVGTGSPGNVDGIQGATLNSPGGLAINAQLPWKTSPTSYFGLYVADTGNQCIRLITMR